MDFHDANGVPDLQMLIVLFGRYDLITAEAWAEWDRSLSIRRGCASRRANKEVMLS